MMTDPGSGSRDPARLAMWDVVVGGGLLIGSIALLSVRDRTTITYAQRTTIFPIVFWISAVCSVLAVVGVAIIEKRWRQSLRPFVTLSGGVGVGSVVLLIGLFAVAELRTMFLLGAIGITIFAAGVAIWRGWRWGGYLQLVFAAAASAYFWWAIPDTATPALLFLFAMFAFLDPVLTFLVSDATLAGAAGRNGWSYRIARPLRSLSRLAFLVFVALTIVFWLALCFGSDGLATAIRRGQQRRAGADLYLLTAAIENYAEAHKSYPAARDAAELARILEPSYMPPNWYVKVLPRNDPWGRPYAYHRMVLASGVDGYVIRTAGADGVFEHTDPTAYRGGEVAGAERDLVVSTVSPSQWPEGQMGP